MSDTGSDSEMEGFATEEQLANLRAIFDKSRRVETKEDILELAKLVEDEFDEDDLVIDHDLDIGTGN